MNNVDSKFLFLLLFTIQMMNPSKVEGWPRRGSVERFVSPGLQGVLSEYGVRRYDSMETWSESYDRLRRLHTEQLDRMAYMERRHNRKLREAYERAEQVLQNRRNDEEYLNKMRVARLDRLSRSQQALLMAYTLENPNFYRRFNKQTRLLQSDDEWNRYEYKATLGLINKLISRHGRHHYSTVVYRGTSALVPARPGSTIMFQHIVSASGARSANDFFLRFLGNGSRRSTVFVMTVRTRLAISSLSEYPREEECILRSHQRFTVTNVVETRNFREVHMVSQDDPDQEYDRDREQLRMIRRFQQIHYN